MSMEDDYHDRIAREREQYREGWLQRGRELNELYEILGPAMIEHTSGNAAEDLRGLVKERDTLRAVLAELVSLKDGERDDYYERRKPEVWQAAREILA